MGIINQFRKQIATHRGDEWSIKIFNCSQNLNECSLARAPQISMPLAKKAIAPLTTGASSGLASLGVDKIFGKGQRGGFLIPMDKIAQLINYKHLLTTGQKKDILKALQTGNGLVIRPTKTQSGGFLGTLLASIGVPLLLDALTGKGLQADRTGSANTTSVYVPDTTNGHGMYNPYPYMSPPFFGTWENPVGAGVKKKRKGNGLLLGKNSPFNSIPILGTIL